MQKYTVLKSRLEKLIKILLHDDIHSIFIKKEIILEMIGILKKFKNDIHVQQDCWLTFSQIAVDESSCETLLELNVPDLINYSLSRHGENDWKLSWLAFSALWNMSLPERTRYLFPEYIIKTIMKAMEKYIHYPYIMNTVFGTLSNLCVEEKFKLLIEKPSLIKIVIKVMKVNSENPSFCSIAFGLVTNLVNNVVTRDILMHCEIVEVMTKIMNHLNTLQHADDQITCEKNFSTTMSNLSSSDSFFSHFLKSGALETIRACITCFQGEEAISILNLIMENLDLELDLQYNSYHLCVEYSCTEELKHIIYEDKNRSKNMNLLDYKNESPITIAIEKNDIKALKLLYLSGAELQKQPNNAILQKSIQRSYRQISLATNKFNKTIISVTYLTPELVNIIIEFCGIYALNKIEYPFQIIPRK